MAQHRCSSNPRQLDYSEVKQGRIDCTVCDWGWRLTPQGWKRVNRREEVAV
jgi:hypothetical protein